MVASAKLEIPLATKVKFAVEGRYDMGLKSVGAGSNTAKFSAVNALGGFVFEL